MWLQKAMIANNAALAIDQKSRGIYHERHYECIAKLSQLIKEETMNLDPISCNLFLPIFFPENLEKERIPVSELEKEVISFRNNLEKFDELESRRQQELMLKCIGLSQRYQSQAYR